MKRLILLSAIIFAGILAGCEQPDPPKDDSKPAPAPQYKMVPSQKETGQ